MSVVMFVPDSLRAQYSLTDEDKSDLGVAKTFGYVCVGGSVFFTLLLWDASWPVLGLLAGLGGLVALAGVNGKRYFRSPADVTLGLVLAYGGGLTGLLLAAVAWAYDTLTAGAIL